jgi:hypothetical protein
MIKRVLLFTTVALAVFSFARGLLYFYHGDYFAPLETTAVLRRFLDGIRFDLSIMLSFIALPLVYMHLPFSFIRNKIWYRFWMAGEGELIFYPLPGMKEFISHDTERKNI